MTGISIRKDEHIRLALSGKSQVGNPGFDKYRFIHNALPEINFDKIDTSTSFLGRKVNFPFFISSMTGGMERGSSINRNLAKAAQKYKIALGVGSQRVAIEHPEFTKQFEIRKFAPDILIIANIGLVQLNYGYGLSEFQKCVDMIDAEALFVHLNPIQEAVQPEGNRNWEKLLPKLEKIVKRLSVPVIVKEVGFGLSEDVVKRLYNIGIRYFDTAGWGGTNWAMIEGKRAFSKTSQKSVSSDKLDTPGLNSLNLAGCLDLNLGDVFSDWGISTTDSIKMCQQFRMKMKSKNLSIAKTLEDGEREMVIIGSGGIRTGLDIAKALALGADLAGVAQPFAKAAVKSQKQVENLIEYFGLGLKIAMFGVSVKNISQLKKAKLTPASY